MSSDVKARRGRWTTAVGGEIYSPLIGCVDIFEREAQPPQTMLIQIVGRPSLRLHESRQFRRTDKRVTKTLSAVSGCKIRIHRDDDFVKAQRPVGYPRPFHSTLLGPSDTWSNHRSSCAPMGNILEPANRPHSALSPTEVVCIL